MRIKHQLLVKLLTHMNSPQNHWNIALKTLFFFIYLVLGINLVSTTTALSFDKSIPIPPPFSGQDAQYFQQAIRAAETGKYTLAIDL